MFSEHRLHLSANTRALLRTCQSFVASENTHLQIEGLRKQQGHDRALLCVTGLFCVQKGAVNDRALLRVTQALLCTLHTARLQVPVRGLFCRLNGAVYHRALLHIQGRCKWQGYRV